jgi:hypothetical protein
MQAEALGWWWATDAVRPQWYATPLVRQYAPWHIGGHTRHLLRLPSTHSGPHQLQPGRYGNTKRHPSLTLHFTQ